MLIYFGFALSESIRLCCETDVVVAFGAESDADDGFPVGVEAGALKELMSCFCSVGDTTGNDEDACAERLCMTDFVGALPDPGETSPDVPSPAPS